jgi:branched-chain amino acid transport system permease protein
MTTSRAGTRMSSILRSSRSRSWIALLAIALVATTISPVLGRYDRDLLTTLLLYIGGAVAWNLVGGIAGQFSLAHSAFIGTGSYAAVMLLRDLRVPVWTALAAAAVGGAILAVGISAILFRLRGAYFTVGSLAVALGALAWMTTWEFTGATTGVNAPISLVPSPEDLYFLAVIVAVLAIASAITVFHSGYGLRLMAVRDDEDVADSLGVSPFATKLIAMVVSGALTGLAGAVLGLQRISVEPFSAFSINWTMTFVVMSIIGGLGTVWGPVIGACLIYYGLTVQLQAFPTLSAIISGLLMIVLIKFLPGGVLGGLTAIRSSFLARLRKGSEPRLPLNR